IHVHYVQVWIDRDFPRKRLPIEKDKWAAAWVVKNPHELTRRSAMRGDGPHHHRSKRRGVCGHRLDEALTVSDHLRWLEPMQRDSDSPRGKQREIDAVSQVFLDDDGDRRLRRPWRVQWYGLAVAVADRRRYAHCVCDRAQIVGADRQVADGPHVAR